MRRGKKNPRQYKLIGFKAYSDEDADLVAWWESVPFGDRSEALRELLRMALGYPQIRKRPEHVLAAVQDDIAWMRDALGELPEYVERVIQHVAMNAVVVSGNQTLTSASNGTGPDDETARRREERMKRRRW